MGSISAKLEISEYKPSQFGSKCSKKDGESTDSSVADALANLKVGDLITYHISSTSCNSAKSLFSHWAVYVGENLMIHVGINCDEDKICKCPDDEVFVEGNHHHMCKVCKKLYRAAIRYDTLDTVLKDKTCQVHNMLDNKYRPLPVNVITQKARSLLGPINYGLFAQNCEHFATFCRYGKALSCQSTVGWMKEHNYVKRVKKIPHALLKAGAGMMNAMGSHAPSQDQDYDYVPANVE